ncbi:MAG: hypothetical protein WCK58_17675, partial [Chloroflexota bacterium]
MRARRFTSAIVVIGRLAVAVALLALLALAGPILTTSARALAADPVAPAPVLFVGDAPFTRNATVELGFVGYWNDVPSGGPVAQYLASNSAATDADGHLAAATVV